ncbi:MULTISPECIES: hypothetical protein [unclassified Helicobacter]|uniref:hypothetical protein n=1 Tax=unclassified Helicobacter TaxID=2593540 RepID=UPI000CF0BB59|nr:MULTISPECIES: hypothetical protein [unclassified Helicobacter]
MKKIVLILFSLQFIFSDSLVEDLPDFTKVVTIRNLGSAKAIKVDRTFNWVIKSITLTEEQKMHDKTFYREFPFGWAQLVKPSDETTCLALLDNKTLGFKSCAQDLGDGKMQTVFSFLPTDRGNVQIRSLAYGGGLCLFVPKSPVHGPALDFSARECIDTPNVDELYQTLHTILPPIVESTVIEP